MSKPEILLIPNLLGEQAEQSTSLPQELALQIQSIRVFAVEHVKDARRLLVKIGLKEIIDQSQFFEINKRTDPSDYLEIIEQAKQGNSIGIISDAGCPGVADPGSILVALAHENNIKVKPLVGPSSILLALMAAGFNGQSFAFTGYLGREKSDRIKSLKALELLSSQKKQTQLFMETPYRNEALFDDILNSLNPSTLLSIACDLTLDSEFIDTKSIAKWKKSPKPKLHKRPAIFSLFVGS